MIRGLYNKDSLIKYNELLDRKEMYSAYDNEVGQLGICYQRQKFIENVKMQLMILFWCLVICLNIYMIIILK